MSTVDESSQETDSQWIRRLASDSAAQSQTQGSPVKSSQIRGVKEGDDKENHEPSDLDSQQNEGMETEEETENPYVRMKEAIVSKIGKKGEDVMGEKGKKGDAPAATEAPVASAALPVEEKESSVVADSQLNEEEAEVEEEEDVPFSRMLSIRHELAERMNAVMNMDEEVKAIVRSNFLLLLDLTTPETPKEEWKKLMRNYAKNVEEKMAGDEQVETDYPREDMSEEEKDLAHRKLTRMVVTRYMRMEMRLLRESRHSQRKQ